MASASTSAITPMPIAMSRLIPALRRSRLMLHDVGVALLHPQGQGRRAVAHQVQPQELNRPQGYGQPEQHRAEDDEDFSGVAGKQEVDELADVGVDDPPLLNGGDDAGEIVVGEDHVGRLLGDVRSRDAHCHPDVRALEGRGVVHAVTCHRHHVPARFHGVDDPGLVLGRDPATDLQVLGLGRQFRVAHFLDFRTGQHDAALGEDADLLRNRFGGLLVVAGDHDAFQPGPVRHFHRVYHLRPRRVDHAEEPEERELLLDALGRAACGDLAQGAIGDSQHPERVARQIPVVFEDLPALRFRQVNGLARLLDVAAEIQQDIGRAFDEGDNGRIAKVRRQSVAVRAIGAVNSRHPLSVRVERNLLDPGHRPLQVGPLESGFPGDDDHGAFRGVADDLP
jgi:hypothetical protein